MSPSLARIFLIWTAYPCVFVFRLSDNYKAQVRHDYNTCYIGRKVYSHVWLRIDADLIARLSEPAGCGAREEDCDQIDSVQSVLSDSIGPIGEPMELAMKFETADVGGLPSCPCPNRADQSGITSGVKVLSNQDLSNQDLDFWREL